MDENLEIQEMLDEDGLSVKDEVVDDAAAADAAAADADTADPNPDTPDTSKDDVDIDKMLDEDDKGDQTDKDTDGDPPAQFKIEEHFEGFTSVDEVKSVVDRGRLFTPEVETELATLRQSATEVEALKTTVKELENRQPFNDTRFYQIDQLTKKDPDKAIVYQKYMFGDKSDVSVVKLRMMLDNPKLFDENPGYLQRSLEAKYPALFEDEPDVNSTEYLDAKTALGIEAATAKTSLDAEINSIEVPKQKTQEDSEKDRTEFISSWQPSFNKIKESLTKLTIPVLDPSDTTKVVDFMDYPIPEGDLKAIRSYAANHILTSQLTPGEEGMKEAMKVATSIYIAENFAKINTAFANKIQKETGAEWRKKVTNPKKAGSDVETVVDKKTELQEGSEEAIHREISLGQY